MRSSISNPSSVYYDQFLSETRSSTTEAVFFDPVPLGPPPYAPGPDYKRIRKSADLLIKAIFGSNQLGNLNTINDSLALVSDDLSVLSASFTDPSVECSSRALKLGYLAINASMLYDCLYDYYENMDLSNPYYVLYDENLSKLKNIMLMCIELMMDTEAYYRLIFDDPGSFPNYNKYANGYWAHDFPSSDMPIYPAFNLIQYRLSMYGALGLTALLLSVTDSSIEDEMLDIVSYVDSMLVTAEIPLTFSDEYKTYPTSTVTLYRQRNTGYRGSQSPAHGPCL
jgi:hypothetical protein